MDCALSSFTGFERFIPFVVVGHAGGAFVVDLRLARRAVETARGAVVSRQRLLFSLGPFFTEDRGVEKADEAGVQRVDPDDRFFGIFT